MSPAFTTKDVAHYYNETLPFYRMYHLNSNGLHFGFSDNTTKSVSEAILNTNKFLANVCKIKPHDNILDAGCGIGGSAIWLAKHYSDIHVTGITLAPNQVKKARELAKKCGVSQRTTFSVMDYMKTTFKSNTFNVVWAIESVCYASDKKKFLQEAFRILKPKGKLIVSDGFLFHHSQTPEEKHVLDIFFQGYRLNDLMTFNEFKKNIYAVGFKHVRFFDKTKAVYASARRAYLLGKLGYPIAYVGWRLGFFKRMIVDNALTAMAQKKGIDMGVGGYGIFYAEKA